MRRHGTHSWPAPVRGWITAGNITQAPRDAADRLDNFFPTAQGARLRLGSTKHATLGAQAVRFVPYASGSTEKLFAGTADSIFEISSPADPDVAPTPSQIGLAGGDWSSVQFGTAGGNFALAVNGTDHAIYFDGTNLNPLVDETVISLPYDALTADFAVGQTVTGGTSGASAEILAIQPTSATAGTLKIGAITSGPFSDNEALTDALTGSATANIPSGTSTASTVTITNIATNLLSQVWSYKERVFFVEKDTLSVWYLPVESIGGAAVEINLGSVFSEGGSLLFGATWSLDTGSGMDDKCVFVTDRGEVAVFSGTDPASAATWGLEGVYRIGKPLSKHAHYSFGGELMIVTNDGILPLSQAIARDYALLVQHAASAPIEDEWQRVVALSSGGGAADATIWHSRGMLIVATQETVDGSPVAFVANSRLGAWCRYVGWDIKASIVFSDRYYFCNSSGTVYLGETSGSDDGMAYTGFYVTKFADMGLPNIKVANHLSVIARTSVPLIFSARALKDYESKTITPPKNLPDPPGNSTWGTAVWGTATWGGSVEKFGIQKWKTVGAAGTSLAGGIAVSSNSTAAPSIEIAGMLLRYEVGEVL